MKIVEGKQRKILPKLGILSFTFSLLPLTSFSPAIAAEKPVLTVVQSPENAMQWAGITSRLSAAGVRYCVIPLTAVKSAADWGDRTVLFLPNVETLTPTQAIALEDWMSKGGRVIASGPVGSSSSAGVRQLLRSVLGAYWGFSLPSPTALQLPKTEVQGWTRPTGLTGKVRGGVVIPTEITSQPIATWDTKDTPSAVVTTERSTLFGWRWGVDAAAAADLDVAWLKAAVNRYLKVAPATSNLSGNSQNCPQVAPIATKPTPPPTPASVAPRVINIAPPATRTSPAFTLPRQDEPINQLEQRVRLDVVPNSNAPISSGDAIALQQDIENLIGRVQSAHLSANAINGSRRAKIDTMATVTIASNAQPATVSKEQAITGARESLQNFRNLVAQRQYAGARQQWLAARDRLWKHFPTDRPVAQPEIRAMWLDRGTIVRAGSEAGLTRIFDQMAQAGINTVFFETVNAGYTIYPSKVAPAQNPLTKGWDPLASAVKLAHSRGMELHAWVWAFAAGNRKHNPLVGKPADYPGPVLAAHPDWASYDNRGSMFPIGQGKPFYDPANPNLRRYLLNLYTEIVTKYKVDGLQLDYIRYPFQDPAADRTYGYGKAARAQFQKLAGVDPLKLSPRQTDLWRKWTEFRTQQIDSFVAELSQKLRKQNPNLILSAAVFPLAEGERIQKLQQHWEVWAQRGDIDVIVPMTYALDTHRFQRLAQPWITSTKLGSSLIVPGIRLLNLSFIGAFDQIQLVRDLPVSGYALFASENLTNELKNIFANTQGSQGTTKEPIPLRQPFQTAVIRFAALRREWDFAIKNNQLQIQSNVVSRFKSEAEILETALNQLANEPSRGKAAAAKAALSAFSEQFRAWMRLNTLNNSYQVQVWQNRLATIDRILRYGEQVQLRRGNGAMAQESDT